MFVVAGLSRRSVTSNNNSNIIDICVYQRPIESDLSVVWRKVRPHLIPGPHHLIPGRHLVPMPHLIPIAYCLSIVYAL